MTDKIKQPQWVGDCKYEWDDVEVRDSVLFSGKGVFAKKKIKMGTMFPILGKVVDNFENENSLHKSSHGWIYTDNEIAIKVDGHPSIRPFQGVGCFGMAIAMMANEETRERPPTCQFINNCLVATGDIEAGEELTTFYGDAKQGEEPYPRIGYTNNNPYRDADLDDEFGEKVYRTLPDASDVISDWLLIIFECFGAFPHEYELLDGTLDIDQVVQEVIQRYKDELLMLETFGYVRYDPKWNSP